MELLEISFDSDTVKFIANTEDVEDQYRKILEEKKVVQVELEHEIVCDFIIKTIEYLYECGFSPQKLLKTLTFIQEFVKYTCNSSLFEAVKYLNSHLCHLKKYLDVHLIRYTMEYLQSTYLTHHNLYKYVLTRPQDLDYTHEIKNIELPPTSAPLSEGVEEIEWRYQQRVKLIDDDYNRQKVDIESNVQTDDSPITLVDSGPMPEEAVAAVVADFFSKTGVKLEDNLRTNLELADLNVTKETLIVQALKARNEERQVLAATKDVIQIKSPKRQKSSPKSK